MILLRIFLLWSTVIMTGAAASAGEIIIKGTYLGKNLFVRNPFSTQNTSFCITDIYLNNARLPNLPRSSAIQIDLSEFALYADIEIRILHNDDCLPIIINPEAIQQMKEFGFLFLQIDDNSINWITAGEMPQGMFLIEKMKLEGWEMEDSVKGKGEMDNNQYSVEVRHYSGDNLFRLIYIDVNGRETLSEEMNFYSLLPPISIDPGEKVDNWISLSRETDYQIFNEEEELIMKGFGDEINVSSLPYGNFEIIIENEPFGFYRLKPEPIPRIRRKKNKEEK